MLCIPANTLIFSSHLLGVHREPLQISVHHVSVCAAHAPSPHQVHH